MLAVAPWGAVAEVTNEGGRRGWLGNGSIHCSDGERWLEREMEQWHGASAAALGEPTANGSCGGQVPGDVESCNPAGRCLGTSGSQQAVLGRSRAAHPQRGTAYASEY